MPSFVTKRGPTMSIPILSNDAPVTDWQRENLLMYLVINSDDN